MRMTKSQSESLMDNMDDSTERTVCRMTRTEVKNDLVIMINLDWCNGCGLCIAFCPSDVLQPSLSVNVKGVSFPVVATPEKCITCRRCQYICPDLSIYLVNKDALPGSKLYTQTPRMKLKSSKGGYMPKRD